MRNAILKFSSQFRFKPRIEGGLLKKFRKFIIVGMGGSALAGELVEAWDSSAQIFIHKNYGIPAIPDKEKNKFLLIAISYSGNTEETLDSFESAKTAGISVAAIGQGGALIERAKEYSVPHIILPNAGIQPRMTTGYGIRAILKLMKRADGLAETKELARILHPENQESEGKRLAELLRGKIPVIYASTENSAIAYNWKIKFNETGKIPAFMNVLPELNHNEMTGFDVKDASRDLSKNFAFIFIRDLNDHPRIKKRMEVLTKLFSARELMTIPVEITGEKRMERIFSSLLLADWAALHTAELYDLEPELVPMVEEFKKLIV